MSITFTSRLTDTGVSNLTTAIGSPNSINITSWKLGSDANITLAGGLTDVVGTVVDSGTTSEMEFDVISSDSIIIRVILEESKGPYDFGNLGLFDDNGDLIVISTFSEQVPKQPNAVGIVGNRFVLSVPINFTNAGDSINFSLFSGTFASWPFVQTIADLPAPDLAPFEGYIVREDPSQNRPITAIRNEEPNGSGNFVWTFDYHNIIAGDSSADQNKIEISTTDGTQTFTIGGTDRVVIDTNGLLKLNETGSAATPAISRISDIDTGLFWPNTNEVALGTNGVQAFRITPGQNIAIGDFSNPLGKAHVRRGDSGVIAVDSSGDTLVVEDSSFSGITILGTGTNNIFFGDSADSSAGGLIYNHFNDDLTFRVNGGSRFRIDGNTGQILSIGVGSSVEPSYSWSTDTDTGIFRNGSGVVSTASNGTEMLRVNPFGIRSGILGTETNPAYAFTLNTGTGVWSPGPNILAFSTNQVERIRITETALELSNNTQLAFPDGSLTSPSITFASDLDMGIFRANGALNITGGTSTTAFSVFPSGKTRFINGGSSLLGDVNIVKDSSGAASVHPSGELLVLEDSSAPCGMTIISPNNATASLYLTDENAERQGGLEYENTNDILKFRASGSTHAELDGPNNQLRVINNGTSSRPAYSFSNDIDTGLFLAATAIMDFVTAGITRFRVNSFGVRVQDGSAATPTYGFLNEPGFNSGMYRIGDNNLGFSVDGTHRMSFTSNIFTSVCTDFTIGHETRRGTPGRALVDNTTELVLNFAGDWTGGARVQSDLSVDNITNSDRFQANIGSLGDVAYGFQGISNGTGMYYSNSSSTRVIIADDGVVVAKFNQTDGISTSQGVTIGADTNTKLIDSNNISKMYAGSFFVTGATLDSFSQPSFFSTPTRLSTGQWRITHNLNTTNISVSLTMAQSSDNTLGVFNQQLNSFDIFMSDTDGSGPDDIDVYWQIFVLG